MAFSKAKPMQEAERLVSQGKTAQAIRQYLEILENDPSDLTLLNTVGDLYIRERNTPEGLRYFHRLAEAYVREGFNVRAIAIYRKISKIDPGTVEILLKLAELYQIQGLGREAREQYLQAADFFKRRKQAEKALEVLRKLVQLDPENPNLRNRLATECEQSGKPGEAAKVHLDFAEAALRRKDLDAAEPALKRAADLDPKNSKVHMLLARAAMSRQQPEEAEKILLSSADLHTDPEGKQILLECCLAAGKHSQAEALVLDVYRSNPSDFAFVSNFVSLCLDKEEVESAVAPLAQLAEEFIGQGHTGPLMEALRKIWNKAPTHLPTLELIYRVSERTGDEFSLPEILEALGHAYVQANELERAATAYGRLTEREPESEHYRALLRQVQQKLGKEVQPVDAEEIAGGEMALAPEGEAPPEPIPVDAEQEAMVKEAIENSDLFARYRLADKALAELDKVLEIYPDQVEIHSRILEISNKDLPARAVEAAGALARIYAARGDEATASKYQAMVSAKGSAPEVVQSVPPVAETERARSAPLVPPLPAVEASVSGGSPAPEPCEAVNRSPVAELAGPKDVLEETQAPPSPPSEIDFDITPAAPAGEPVFELTPQGAVRSATPEPAAFEMEYDLSDDLEALTARAAKGLELPTSKVEAPTPPAEPIPQVNASTDQTPDQASLLKGTVEAEGTEGPVEVSEPPSAVPAESPSPTEEAPARQEMQAAPIPSADAIVAPTPEAAIAEPTGMQTAETTLPQLLEAASLGALSPPMEVAAGGPSPIAGADHAPFNYEESKLEIDFYLEHGFVEEARQAVTALEERYPGNECVAGLRRQVEESAGQGEAAPAEVEVDEAAPAEVEEAAPDATLTPPPRDEWELPSTYAAAASPPAKPAGLNSSPATGVFEMGSSHPARGGVDLFGDLTSDLATHLDNTLTPAAPSKAPPRPSVPVPGGADLSGLLEGMDESGFGQATAEDDPETHYNLGVAFREMGLLEEAIGEFQKVVRAAGKGHYPQNFLPACSLLAICFMEKKMPTVAIKWYTRALETPDLEEEAVLALQYDLGLAYEQAGDSQSALERFTEVYSQNIDFRDVAEKIRLLQQKV